MNNPLADLTVCVIDNGLHCAWAERIARDAGRTLYWKPWVTSFPTSIVASIGKGIQKVEVIKDLDAQEDDIDLFIVLDVHFGALQKRLLRRNKLVFGSREGDELELYRWYAKEMMRKVGIPVGTSYLVKGLDALEKFLTGKQDVWVKVSEFRGLGETWHHWNITLSRSRLDRMRHKLGPLGNSQEFIIEEPIPTKGEVGFDHYTVQGKYADTVSFGFEQKDCAYCGVAVPYNKLPKDILEVNRKLAPVFAAYDYRGFVSTEIRDGKVVDMTCRSPEPPGSLYLEWFENLAEIIYETAQGNLVETQFKAPYAVELILYSENAAEDALCVQYPEEVSRFVKLYNEYRDADGHWVLPTDAGLVQVGGVLGFGDTIEAAFSHALAVRKQVKGDGLEVKEDAIPQLLDTIRKSVSDGVYFGESDIPKEIPS